MKTMKTTILLLLLILFFAGRVHSDQGYPGMKPLTGQFDLTGQTPVDPPPEEPRNTHLRIYLTGEAARTLYTNMKVTPQKAMCGEKNQRLEKTIGEMLCSASDGTKYECWFAIDIAKQKISGGWAC